MTRKITLSIVLIILILGCYELMFGDSESIRKNVASVSQLETASKDLDTAAAMLERNSTTDYEDKKNQLTKAIEEYQETKKEYDELVPQTVADEMVGLEESSLKDIYDVDFLWTIVGNYATEEGINLKFDIQKNTTSASSINNTSSNYIVCDLKFVITGNYINLTDFIYDIEDDDRLNFEINNFEMQKDGENLQVTLTVREIKINSSNLIDSGILTNSVGENTEIDTTQTIDSNTTNTVPAETTNETTLNDVN